MFPTDSQLYILTGKESDLLDITVDNKSNMTAGKALTAVMDAPIKPFERI